MPMTFEDIINHVISGDCIAGMRRFPDECMDLTVTSCPWGMMRLYKGKAAEAKGAVEAFHFDPIASELYRVTRDGGILAWSEADQRKDFSLSGLSFQHCLSFKKLGFKYLDFVIVDKNGLYNQYPYTMAQTIEFVFILLKGDRPNIPDSNILRDRENIHPGTPYHGNRRQKDDSLKIRKVQIAGEYSKGTQVWDLDNLIKTRTPDEFKARLKAHTGQVWDINVAGGLMDTIVPIPVVNGLAKNKHPAVMSDVLAERLVQQYSMPGDLVFDPMDGFGTTTAVAALHSRRWLGVEYNEAWAEVANQRTINAYLTRVES